METKERISKAVETLDHLLWEAIIRVCGMALSKTFELTENSVRVVYQTWNSKLRWCIKEPIDPRDVFLKVTAKVEYFISLHMRVRKLGKEYRNYNVANGLCSNPWYQLFLIDILAKQDRIDLNCLGNCQQLVLCDFVEFRHDYSGQSFCCPCVGEHLSNTSELYNYNHEIHEPKKVGKNSYEFRFTVTAK